MTMALRLRLPARRGRPNEPDARRRLPLSRAWLGVLAGLAVAATVAAPVAGATPADYPGPIPREAWRGGVELFRADAFTSQPNYVTCVPTSVQMMLNLIQDTEQHSTSQILSYYRWGRAHNAYHYTTLGLDPQSWAGLLSTYGGGPYVDLSFDSYGAALSAAAYELRLTNKPIGLLVDDGHHAWVMTGFTGTADPLVSPGASITQVTVMGSLHPRPISNGYDPPPGDHLSPAELRTYLTPYQEVFPVRWTGKYVIVAPKVLSPALNSFARVLRQSGPDRYATALALSRSAYPSGAPTVYVASGADFAGALAAGPAAAAAKGPILLADGASLRADIAAELRRLHPGRIVVVDGGTYSDAFVASLRAYAGNVVRLRATDRVGLALAVSRYAFPKGAPVAYLATGANFPDALAGAAQAARDGGPVLLTSGTASLPSSVRDELVRLAPSRIVILGGTASVSQAIEDDVAAIAPVSRLAGDDRYGTAAAISAATAPGVGTMYVAAGKSYPDALAAAPIAAKAKAPVLLVPWDSIPDVIAAELARLHPGRIVVLGGPVSVSDSVAGW